MERPDKGQGVETRIVRIGADGAPPSDQAPPIFIIGNGRSGTTLLRLMLSAHPNIHLTHEASFWLWERRAPASLDGEALLRFYIKSLHFRWLRQDPADVVRG
ncbi:MAG: sulfotransferase, partial [Myxococcota bacterium]